MLIYTYFHNIWQFIFIQNDCFKIWIHVKNFVPFYLGIILRKLFFRPYISCVHISRKWLFRIIYIFGFSRDLFFFVQLSHSWWIYFGLLIFFLCLSSRSGRVLFFSSLSETRLWLLSFSSFESFRDVEKEIIQTAKTYNFRYLDCYAAVKIVIFGNEEISSIHSIGININTKYTERSRHSYKEFLAFCRLAFTLISIVTSKSKWNFFVFKKTWFSPIM